MEVERYLKENPNELLAKALTFCKEELMYLNEVGVGEDNEKWVNHLNNSYDIYLRIINDKR